jgi:hypothetical protein
MVSLADVFEKEAIPPSRKGGGKRRTRLGINGSLVPHSDVCKPGTASQRRFRSHQDMLGGPGILYPPNSPGSMGSYLPLDNRMAR